MDKIVKQILEKIESNGFEAYIVGGFVRDYIRGIKSNDVDICTNARPIDLINIFPMGNAKSDEYGAFKLTIGSFHFDITTYRKEIEYIDGKPKLEYVNNLLEDINRRDFTVNTICMTKEGNIIDILNGISDIQNKILKIVGDLKGKLTEDPLRMIRAIRFSATLDFEIDKEIIEFIKINKSLLSNVSKTKLKYEIDCILISPKALKGLNLIKNLKLDKELGISYKDVYYVDNICGMWSQINYSDDYNFTKEEKKTIIEVKEIVKEGKITSNIVYKYGLYVSTIAGSLLKINTKIINKMYNKLCIHSIQDIDITSEEIITILNIEPSVIIKSIYETLESNILTGKLSNKNKNLKEYIKNNKGMWI